MAILLLVVFIFLSVALLTSFFGKKKYSCYSDDYHEWARLPIVLSIACLIAILVLAGGVQRGKLIDQKIEMLQSENASIELKVESAVKAYLEYEGKTYKDMKADEGSYVAVVAAYPELASQELVKTQVELYIYNTEKIKELKSSKIDLAVKRWWLYFG